MTETTELRVTDFDCPTCASNVERAIQQVDGVDHVAVHYTTGRVEVEYDPASTDPEAFATAIENQGYTPQRA